MTNLSETIRTEARAFADSHFAVPSQADRTLVENAMLTGCAIALRYALDVGRVARMDPKPGAADEQQKSA